MILKEILESGLTVQIQNLDIHEKELVSILILGYVYYRTQCNLLSLKFKTLNLTPGLSNSISQ